MVSRNGVSPLWGEKPDGRRKNRFSEIEALVDGLDQKLFKWQEYVLRSALEWQPREGRWRYRRVCLSVPRRAGKTFLLQLRGLMETANGGKILSVSDTAYKQDLVLNEVQEWIVDGKIPGGEFKQGHGGIWKLNRKTSGSTIKHLPSGGEWRVLPKNPNRARGFGASLLMLDEAALLNRLLLDAITPTMAQNRNRQVWFASNAGEDSELSAMWRGMFELGEKHYLKGIQGERDTAWYHYGAAGETDIHNPKVWLSANPSSGELGGVDPEFLREQYEAYTRENRLGPFAREYMNLWSDRIKVLSPIDQEAWGNCYSPNSKMPFECILSAEVDDMGRMVIMAAGWIGDRIMLEQIGDMTDIGVGQNKLAEIAKKRRCTVVLDAARPLSYLLADLAKKGIRVQAMSWPMVLNSCVSFSDRVKQEMLIHRNQPQLNEAVQIAVKRNQQEKDGRWAWGTRPGEKSSVAPLAAASLVSYACVHWPPKARFKPILIQT